MFTELKHVLERRVAVRADGAELVRSFGPRGADIASQRARGPDMTVEQCRHWHDVAAFAQSWHEHLDGLDTATRYLHAQRYLRRA